MLRNAAVCNSPRKTSAERSGTRVGHSSACTALTPRAEDTVLFPALHKILTAAEMDKLGDQFEDEENRLFGKEGFEHVVAQVAEIEKQLGILDLDQFTPKP